MKNIMIAVALIASFNAFADSTSATQQQGNVSTTQVQSGADATSSNAGQGNGNNVTFAASVIPTDTTTRQVVTGGTDSTVRQEFGTQVIKNTPSVSGPALTSSNDTCMGSTSASANVPGIGIGFGTSWVDGNCKMLKNSRELWNMGMKGAAMALMCNDADNRAALEISGFECPQTTKARNGNMEVQKAAAVSQEQYTDPVIRARLGLAPLVASK